MGRNVVREAVNDTANISISQINKATQNNSKSTSASELIQADGCKNVDIENVSFTEVLTIDVEAQLKAYQSNASQADIKRQIEQVSKQIAGWLALSSNEADIVTNLVTNLTNNMSNTFVQSCNNSTSIRQGAICQDTDNFTIKGVTFTSYLNEVTNCIGNQQAVNDSKQQLADYVSQKSSQVTLGIYGFLYWLLGIVGAIMGALVFIAITVAISGTIIFADPIFIFGFFLMFGAAFFLLIAFGYFPQWWPYQTTTVLDDDQTTKDAKKKNLTLFSFALGLGLLFLALAVLIFFRGPKVPKKPPTKTQTFQKLQAEALLKRELEIKQQELGGRLPPPPDRDAPDLPMEDIGEKEDFTKGRDAPENPKALPIPDDVEEAVGGGNKESIIERAEEAAESKKGEFFPEAEEGLKGVAEEEL